MLQEPDPDPFQRIGQTQPKARKPYKCSYCSVLILKGEKHNKHFIKDEDKKVFTERHHIMCPIEVY